MTSPMNRVSVALHCFPVGLLGKAFIDMTLARFFEVLDIELSGQAVGSRGLGGGVVDESQSSKGSVCDTSQSTLTVSSEAVCWVPDIGRPDALRVIRLFPVAVAVSVHAFKCICI